MELLLHWDFLNIKYIYTYAYNKAVIFSFIMGCLCAPTKSSVYSMPDGIFRYVYWLSTIVHEAAGAIVQLCALPWQSEHNERGQDRNLGCCHRWRHETACTSLAVQETEKNSAMSNVCFVLWIYVDVWLCVSACIAICVVSVHVHKHVCCCVLQGAAGCFPSMYKTCRRAVWETIGPLFSGHLIAPRDFFWQGNLN